MNFLTFALIIVFASNLSASCPNDPAEWCLNIENAKSCNIVKQCWENVWSMKRRQGDQIEYTGLVNFTLYYETLCPDCKNFMSSQILNAFFAVKEIMNLTLIPYGNAKETWRNETKLWQFECQHGSEECWGNLLHTCVIFSKPKTVDHLPFILCMEGNNVDDIQTSAKKCGLKYNVSIEEMEKCMFSRLGNSLQHEMAAKTEILNPPHKYVPWITLNGEHTDEIQKQAENNLVDLICKTYKGTKKPEACNQKQSRKCLKI